MRDGRTVSRIVGIVAAVVAVLSICGIVVTIAINAFVLDKYNAYGEVPIPGKTTLYLPAGDVAINFHTQVIGSTGGGGLPLPPLTMDITPPAGVPEPDVTESRGGTTTINGDAHRRVWTMRVKGEGGYAVTVDGPVNGFINPRLAFGDNAGMNWPIWMFVVLTVLSADLAIAVWWFRRRRAAARASSPGVIADRVAEPFPEPVSEFRGDPYTPTDEAVRLEQLKTIAALRDSGALTGKEFEAEKRRILDGR